MIARLVTRREDTESALVLTGLPALALALIVIDDLVRRRLWQVPSDAAYAFVAILIVLAGVGPWFARTQRGRATTLRVGERRIVAGDTMIEASDVTGVSVAEAARGRSIAVACGSRITFIEVERAEDTALIVHALAAEATPFGSVPVRPASRLLALVQATFTLATLVCAPLYWLAATQHVDSLDKAVFGVAGVSAAGLSLALLVVRTLVPSQAVAVGRAAYDVHVALHASNASASGASPPPPEPARVRIATLERGDEPVAAWLARIDALPAEAHAYRDSAMKKDVLWETLRDDQAPVDARMAAARVLARQHGEKETALMRVVTDPDVRVRVEAALEEEQDDAERRIETLGPLFRAR